MNDEQPRVPAPTGRDAILAWVALGGGVVAAGTAFLPWSWSPAPLDNLTWYGNPGFVQYVVLVMGLLAVGLSLRWRFGRPVAWLDPRSALRPLGIGIVAVVATAIGAIALGAGGLVNVEPGGWIALVGAAAVAAAAVIASPTPATDPLRARYRSWVEILAIMAMLGALLGVASFALGMSTPGTFLCVVLAVAATAVAAAKGGLFSWLGAAALRHNRVLMLGGVVTAFAFPLTQTNDANMSIATQVLIFATTALGLNIVVGLAGLLDLGYVAFLGAGAYVGALLSGSVFSVLNIQPPFLVTMLLAGCFSALLGLVIGSPTLRVSGDYLAIVTLAFGEIFRLTVNNLDGSTGPQVTRGPNGITQIPELNLFGFDFGDPPPVFGIEISREAAYYFLLLLVAISMIAIFIRLNDSRIGRGWVAIREDEKAAEATGVNVFGLKLFAFASGAFLAGVAGSVKAHLDRTVAPNSYEFLESAFLLAAVVLGGMGTVAGVLVGSIVLKAVPEKLRFIDDYRLLLFGALLVLMMRFRPEGLIPSRRRRLEFHDDDAELVEQIDLDRKELKEASS